MTPPFRITMGLLLGAALLGACSGPSPSGAPGKSETTKPPARAYHVQLQLTEDKDRAEALLSRGLQWWTNQPSASRPPLVQQAPSSDSAVHIKWKAPFYRVRVGPFATEKQAETVLQNARSAFPEAFVAPARVDAQAPEDEDS